MDLTSFGVKNKDSNSKDLKNKSVVEKDESLREMEEEIIDIKFIDDVNLNIDFNNFSAKFEKKEDKYLPWFLKYQLKNFEDLIITKELKKVVDFFDKFKPGKGLFLIGPAGCGKTTTLNLFGEHYGYEIFELNASDARSKKSINEHFDDIIFQKSLFGKSKLIIVDEVDGISGTKDRGGASEIVKYLKKSPYPIVFTANDYDSDKIKPLKKVSTVVDFQNHSYELLLTIGQRILEKERVEYKKQDLEEFIESRAISDIRGFINDLQASVYNLKFQIEDYLDPRDYKKEIEILLDKIYYSYPEESYFQSFNTDVNLDDLFLYLEENSPNIFSKRDLISAFNELSKADVQRGRIRKWQYWRFLVYINFYLTYGISSSKNDNVNKSVYKRNGRILKKWIYSNKVGSLKPRTSLQKKNQEDEKFIEILAKKFSRSADRTRKEDLYYYAFIYQNSKEFRDSQKEAISQLDSSVDKALLEL